MLCVRGLGCLVGAIPGTYAGEKVDRTQNHQTHMHTTQIDVHALAAELATLIADHQPPAALLDAEAAADLLNVVGACRGSRRPVALVEARQVCSIPP